VAARISEIAETAHCRFVRLPRRVRDRRADSRPGIAQRQHRAFTIDPVRAQLDGMEVGAGHFRRYSSTRMTGTRLEALKNMVAQQPNETFLRYGLAMEYKNTGELEAAIV